MIYHITPVDNLPSIVADGVLLSDAAMNARGGPATTIGIANIKRRRLSLPVRCHPGDSVGDYVPFYFCQRSIMLYLIYRGNHPELTYRGGQGPILHLEADLHEVVAWADHHGRRWAFSLSNAGSPVAEFRNTINDLNLLNWPAIGNTDFTSSDVHQGKQAEFLIHERLPWELITRIGVHSANVQNRVNEIIAASQHVPSVEIRRAWYY